MPEKADDLLTPAEIVGPLYDLWHTGPDDAAACATLIERHCSVCRQHRRRPELERAAECYQWRCTLRDPAELARERDFLFTTLWALRDPNNADDADVQALNKHIARCGSATIGLGGRSAGFRRLAFEGSTLRAVLHRAVILHLSWQAGERVHLNVNAMGVTDLLGLVKGVHRESRAEQAHRREVEDDARVLGLHQQGYKPARIAREMGWGNDRSRVNRALQRQGVKEKGERFTERTGV